MKSYLTEKKIVYFLACRCAWQFKFTILGLRWHACRRLGIINWNRLKSIISCIIQTCECEEWQKQSHVTVGQKHLSRRFALCRFPTRPYSNGQNDDIENNDGYDPWDIHSHDYSSAVCLIDFSSKTWLSLEVSENWF